MAIVKPLIRYSDTGMVEELRTGDTTPGGSSGGKTFAFFIA